MTSATLEAKGDEPTVTPQEAKTQSGNTFPEAMRQLLRILFTNICSRMSPVVSKMPRAATMTKGFRNIGNPK